MSFRHNTPLVKGVASPLVASALGGSLTRVASGHELLCRRAGADRFAVRIKAYCVLTQLVVRLAVAAHDGCAGSASMRAQHALRCFTGLRNVLALFPAPLATSTVSHALPVLRVGGARGDGGVRLHEMPLVVACDSGLEASAKLLATVANVQDVRGDGRAAALLATLALPRCCEENICPWLFRGVFPATMEPPNDGSTRADVRLEIGTTITYGLRTSQLHYIITLPILRTTGTESLPVPYYGTRTNTLLLPMFAKHHGTCTCTALLQPAPRSVRGTSYLLWIGVSSCKLVYLDPYDYGRSYLLTPIV
eukprot:COSAG01_NODE_18810_length_1051_cov_2.238445_2_plen_306_part_01